jgi:hypothetical protein
MSWKFDAPSGVYRNHALSTDIRREAIADVQFMRFMRPEPGFGKKKGESVTITRIMALPHAQRVGENEALPSGRPAIETKTVGVSQWGAIARARAGADFRAILKAYYPGADITRAP